MLTFNEWDFLQQLILILGPFEEATRYLGGEKYITYSIMNPIIEEIKKLLIFPTSPPISPTSISSSTLPISTPFTSTLVVSESSFNTPEIRQEIENADDVFVIIEEVEIQENSIIETNNNNNNPNIDLNRPFETENALDKVKKHLYSAMCHYWNFISDDILLSTILDPRIKSIGEKTENEKILRKYYEEY